MRLQRSPIVVYAASIVLVVAALFFLSGCAPMPVLTNTNGSSGAETWSVPGFAPVNNACDPCAQPEK